jgi:hypothetical protein
MMPMDFLKAMGNHVAPSALVVGDPTSFNRGGYDKGWDLESKIVVGKPLLEYELDWQNKTVKSPITGNQVKVGSLPPDEQEKYRPKHDKNPDDSEKSAGNGGSGDDEADKKFSTDGQKYKAVPGGVVINKPINPSEFKEKVKNMKPASSLNVKKWNSKFDIFTDDKGNNHLYMSTYDRGEFDVGATNPERANTVKLVGVFKSPMDAKKYVMGGDEKLDLDQNKRVTVAKQTPWSPKEMGI